MSFLFEPENLLPKDGIAIYHGGIYSDKEVEMVAESSIASLSLGAARKFAFKHATTNERLDIELANGSLLDMKGAIQQHWYHSLPKTKKVKQMRINLTFRLMHQL